MRRRVATGETPEPLVEVRRKIHGRRCEQGAALPIGQAFRFLFEASTLTRQARAFLLEAHANLANSDPRCNHFRLAFGKTPLQLLRGAATLLEIGFERTRVAHRVAESLLKPFYLG